MSHPILHNKLDKASLRKKLEAESFKRITLSFYRYVILDQLDEVRDVLWNDLCALDVFGRVYVAREGINAQISVPEQNFSELRRYLDNDVHFKEIPFKIAVEDDGKSFYKLIVRKKTKIVADGLRDDSFDVTNVGNHLSAQEFNKAMDDKNTLVVDMRNHYESEVGLFQGALVPDADTFRQALPEALELLKGNEDKKILLYCTGGIRCEKASAYLKHHGYKDVNQLHGGIIAYAHEVKEHGLENKFIGKNFVFDSRMGERISDEIISTCHQCGSKSDRHVNCANDDCHLLFIQCENCSTLHKGCCTPECMAIASMPIDEQRKLRKGKIKTDSLSVYKSRLRPKLKEYFQEKK